MRLLSYALALTALAVDPLSAQRPITVAGVRSLSFGAVLPGVPTVVPRTSAANAGQFDLTGPHDSQAALTFTLPVVMTGPAGATLPLLFRGSEAGLPPTPSLGAHT